MNAHRRRALFAAGGSVLVVAATMAAPADAQNLPPEESVRFSRYTPVRERQIPGYEQVGVPIGALTLSPNLDVSANANDNVYALEDGAVADGYLRIAPSARLSSNWVGRSLDVSADATIDRYADQTTENVNAINVTANASQQFAGAMQLRLLGRLRSNRESRESQNAFALTDRPVKFMDATGAAGLTKRMGFIQLAVEGGYQDINYDDATLRSGGTLDQDYRDGHVRSLRGRVDFIQSSALAYFVQATNSKSSYLQPSTADVARGADTIEVLVGTRFELPILARGEIGIGYITSTYRDVQFARYTGLAINSNVTFFPTQLTTVRVNALRSVNDAGTIDSSNYVSLSGGFVVDHELLRSLIVSANAQYQRDSFNGVDRRDDRLSLGASAEYRMNRMLSVRASFDRLDLSSEGAARYKSFTRNRSMIGVGVRI